MTIREHFFRYLLVLFLVVSCSLEAAEGTSRVIIIDPGHGGKDPGTLSGKVREKNLSLAIAKKLGRTLKQRFSSRIYYTRLSDHFVTLGDRNRIANRNSCDLFLSLHVNSAPNKNAEGVEIYYLNNATDRAAEKLAARENAGAPRREGDVQAILSGLIQNAATIESAEAAEHVRRSMQKKLVKKFGMKDVRVKTALFYVLVGAKCPSLLIETGFITNKKDLKLLKSDRYQSALSTAIVDGIDNYFKSLANPKSDL